MSDTANKQVAGPPIEWRVIPMACKYEASNHGSVRVLATQHVMKAKISKNGYLAAALSIGGKKKLIHTHTLVCNAFYGKRPEGLVTRHLDGDKLNANLGNLCYGTHKENAADKVLHGTDNTGERNGRAKITAADARAIRAAIADGATIKGLARMHGLQPITIREIRSREIWRSA